jgi:hypothetical protein
VQVNIAIMRAFVRLREMLLTNAELARKLADLERKYDSQFKAVFDAIRQLMAPPPPPPPNLKSASMSRRLPFHTASKDASPDHESPEALRPLASALSSAPQRRQKPHRQSARIDAGRRKLSL